MAIITKDYPKTNLRVEEHGDLEDAIMSEISGGYTSKLQFVGIYFRPGFVMVECVGQETADCLRAKAPQLRGWKCQELIACLGNITSRRHM